MLKSFDHANSNWKLNLLKCNDSISYVKKIVNIFF